MFKLSSQEYTFIYLLTNNYYKLVIKSNMLNIIQQIILELQKKYKNKENTITNTIRFIELNNLFSVVSNDLLNNLNLLNQVY